jgi:hypothetical protein
MREAARAFTWSRLKVRDVAGRGMAHSFIRLANRLEIFHDKKVPNQRDSAIRAPHRPPLTMGQ